MKKCLLVFSGLFGLIFFVNAIPVSLYLGTSNSFSFPIIRGDLHSALTSFGFSGTSIKFIIRERSEKDGK